MLNKVLKNITSPVFILSFVAFMVVWQMFIEDFVQEQIIDRLQVGGGEE
ncbi:hypothetical protein ES703_73680 [subsurface metagenome]